MNKKEKYPTNKIIIQYNKIVREGLAARNIDCCDKIYGRNVAMMESGIY